MQKIELGANQTSGLVTDFRCISQVQFGFPNTFSFLNFLPFKTGVATVKDLPQNMRKQPKNWRKMTHPSLWLKLTLQLTLNWHRNMKWQDTRLLKCSARARQLSTRVKETSGVGYRFRTFLQAFWVKLATMLLRVTSPVLNNSYKIAFCPSLKKSWKVTSRQTFQPRSGKCDLKFIFHQEDYIKTTTLKLIFHFPVKFYCHFCN